MRLTTIGMAVVAAIVGSLVGIVAIYVSETGSGNIVGPRASGEAAKAANARQSDVAEERLACADAPIRAGKLADFATGDVAAMIPMTDRGLDISPVAFKGPDSSALTIGSFAGRTTLVNLWATWCVPCREEMPALDQLQAARGSEDFEVVAINIDSGAEGKPRAFLDEIGITDLAFYRDETIGVFNDMKRHGLAIGLPVTLLVDEQGCVLASMNGPAHWDGNDAGRLVDQALSVSGTLSPS